MSERRKTGRPAVLKMVVLLGAGVALGAFAAHSWVARDADRTDTASVGGSFAERGGALRLGKAPQASSLQSRVDAYRAASGFDDAAALADALAAAAARPESSARTLELDALLLRFVELDA